MGLQRDGAPDLQLRQRADSEASQEGVTDKALRPACFEVSGRASRPARLFSTTICAPNPCLLESSLYTNGTVSLKEIVVSVTQLSEPRGVLCCLFTYNRLSRAPAQRPSSEQNSPRQLANSGQKLSSQSLTIKCQKGGEVTANPEELTTTVRAYGQWSPSSWIHTAEASKQ